TGIVSGAVVDQHAGVVVDGKGAQDLSELSGAELARSTGARHALGQPADPLPVVGRVGHRDLLVFRSRGVNPRSLFKPGGTLRSPPDPPLARSESTFALQAGGNLR